MTPENWNCPVAASLTSSSELSKVTVASIGVRGESQNRTLPDISKPVATGFDISGSVRFWDSPRTPIEATVTLDNSLEEVSDAATGQFQFSGVIDGTHTFNIEKDDGSNDSVRGYDASLILSLGSRRRHSREQNRYCHRPFQY